MNRILFAAALLPFTAFADDAPISTDRGGPSAPASTVPAQRLQIETGFNFAREGSADVITIPTLVRYGLVEHFEVRVGSNLVNIDREAEKNSVTDTLVGARVAALFNDGGIPDLAFTMDVFLPSGEGSDESVPDLRACASWALGDQFGLLVNTGLTLPTVGDERVGQGIFIGSFSYAPSAVSGFSIYAEGFGLVAAGDLLDDEYYAAAGLVYQLTDDFQLDIYSQHALNDAGVDLQVSAGVGVRL